MYKLNQFVSTFQEMLKSSIQIWGSLQSGRCTSLYVDDGRVRQHVVSSLSNLLNIGATIPVTTADVCVYPRLKEEWNPMLKVVLDGMDWTV